MQDIVSCGFVKGLSVSPQSGHVTFALELTTPACPIKGEFERKARDYVAELPWVQQVQFALCDLHMQCSQFHTKRMRSLSACNAAAVYLFASNSAYIGHASAFISWAERQQCRADMAYACWRRWM